MSENSIGQEVQLHIGRPASDEYPAAGYANQVQITYTAEDFTLWFGRYSIPALEAPPEDGRIEASVAPVAQITMPLNLMRNFAALIEVQIRQYEASFGQEIPEHPNKPPWLREQEKEQSG